MELYNIIILCQHYVYIVTYSISPHCYPFNKKRMHHHVRHIAMRLHSLKQSKITTHKHRQNALPLHNELSYPDNLTQIHLSHQPRGLITILHALVPGSEPNS